MGMSRVRASAAQAPRDRQARLPRQHPVEQDQVGQGLAYDGERLLRVRGAQGMVPGALKVDGNQFLDGGFVFDDQYIERHDLVGAIVCR